MPKRKAFTLVELLVVVIVVGVLAGVAVPKFTRVLENRKTTEAEQLLAAVRTEQEKRCIVGKKYLTTQADLPVLAGANQSAYYTYELKPAGIVAQSKSKAYSLSMPSYKNGTLCCSGAYCDRLDKNYPVCSDEVVADECAAEEIKSDPCDINPNVCSCSAYASTHACECAGNCTPCELDATSCECNPNQAKCCAEGEEWNGTACQEKEQCVTSYGEAQEATSATADTCPGNDTTGQYSCDGSYIGTCTDVFSSSASIRPTASRVQDPFNNFRNAILLAAVSASFEPVESIQFNEEMSLGEEVGGQPTLVNEGLNATNIDGSTTCPDGKTRCPKGYVCKKDGLSYICDHGIAAEDDSGFKLCPDGIWRQSCDSLSIGTCDTPCASSNFTQDPVTCECSCNKTCGFKETLNVESCTCEGGVTIVEPVLLLSKRTVTCCGNEEPPIVEKKCAMKDKPSTTKTQNNCSYSRTVSCEDGTWVTGSWVKGECSLTTCDDSKKPNSQTVACGNCNKGTMTKTPVCQNGAWVYSEGACSISADVCTPGATDYSRGKTCTTTSNLDPDDRIGTIRPAEDELMPPDNVAMDTIAGEKGESSPTISTYKSGATCSNSCVWVDNNCPSSGGGGGGGGGIVGGGCGPETVEYRAEIGQENSLCHGWATIDTCTGDMLGWTDNGLC